MPTITATTWTPQGNQARHSDHRTPHRKALGGTITEFRQCKATAKGTGQRCKRRASPGANVCVKHGAGAPQVRAKAARNVKVADAQADAQSILAKMGLEPLGDPILELGKLAREVTGMKDALASRVNALSELTDVTPLGAIQIKAEIELYERAIDRSVKVLDILGKHDLEDRQVKVTEALAGQFREVCQRWLATMDLTQAQQSKAWDDLRPIMRQVLG